MPGSTSSASSTPRKGSNLGRKIEQRHPLEKGRACATCKARKVRCDGLAACGACLRTARFEKRDPALVRCEYNVKPLTVAGEGAAFESARKGKGKATKAGKKVARHENHERGSLGSDATDMESILRANLALLSASLGSDTASTSISTSTSSSSCSTPASSSTPAYNYAPSFEGNRLFDSVSYQYDEPHSTFSSDSGSSYYPSSDESEPSSPSEMDSSRSQFSLPPLINGNVPSSSLPNDININTSDSLLQLYPDFSNLFLPPQQSTLTSTSQFFLPSTSKEISPMSNDFSSWFSPSLFSNGNLAPSNPTNLSPPSLYFPSSSSSFGVGSGSISTTPFPPQFKNGEHVLDTLVPAVDGFNWSSIAAWNCKPTNVLYLRWSTDHSSQRFTVANGGESGQNRREVGLWIALRLLLPPPHHPPEESMLLGTVLSSLAILQSTAAATQYPWLVDSPAAAASNEHHLTLRHAVHLSHTDRSRPALHRTFSPADLISASSLTGHSSTQTIRTTTSRAWRPTSDWAYQAQRRSNFYLPRAMRAGRALTANEIEDSVWGATLEWEENEIEVPDVTDVNTIASLAKMTSNAYSDAPENWYDLDGRWNVSNSFGWLEDGIRGHVYADATNSTVVVSIKGTTNGFLGGGGATGKNDKTNDNLLFSCCCARVDWSWSTVCDCYAGGYSCTQNCIEDAVMSESAYYPVATDLYNNITSMYPNAQIWLSGHSLGGALAAMLSLTYGIPSVSFESPGDLLPARRLHLPLPPGNDYLSSNITTHVYHTADPIAMGVCNGALSTCAVAGYALESRCHTGKSIVYDTVGKLGWSVDIRTHRINAVIDNLLIEDWGIPRKDRDKKTIRTSASHWLKTSARGWGWWPGGGGTSGNETENAGDRGVPSAVKEEDCVDCFKWVFE